MSAAGSGRPARRSAASIAVVLLVVGVLSAGKLVQSVGIPLSAEQAALRIDPNSASAAELMLLPGIGEKLAAAIISHRESAPRRPAFRRAGDLDFVPRIGPVLIERWRPLMVFPETPFEPEFVLHEAR